MKFSIIIFSILFFTSSVFSKNKELVGFIIDCFGTCEQVKSSYYSKLDYKRPVFRDQIIKTSELSSLWLISLNGSLVRMSQNTQLKLNSYFHKKENTDHLDLIEGQVFIRPRKDLCEADFKEDSATDVLPLKPLAPNIIKDREKSLKRLVQKNKLINKNTSLVITSKDMVIESSSAISLFSNIEAKSVVGVLGDCNKETKTYAYLTSNEYKKESLTRDKWYYSSSKGFKELNKNIYAHEFSLFVKNLNSYMIAGEWLLLKNKVLSKPLFYKKDIKNSILSDFFKKPKDSSYLISSLKEKKLNEFGRYNDFFINLSSNKAQNSLKLNAKSKRALWKFKRSIEAKRNDKRKDALSAWKQKSQKKILF